MATAIELNARSTLINGHGLAESADFLNEISTFQAHPIIPLIADTYSMAITSNSNVELLSALSNLCSGVTSGQWLIDAWPGNISPVCSSASNPYSFSSTINTQAALPFASGMSGFANVYQTAYGFMQQGFDTVASIYMLQNKTYAQSGLGYTGPKDLATNGINNKGSLLGNVILGWGTMYDINNIATIGDPYVFGQNLLNQGLGNYGNLSAQLSAAGLNINNLSAVPQNTTTTARVPTSVSVSTPIGPIDIPSTDTVTTTTAVSGNSQDVVLSIYKTITGTDLQAIVTATNVTIANSSITTLADYLNFNKIVSAVDLVQLNNAGVSDFSSFSKYLQAKLGGGYFKSWNAMATLLNSIEVPTLSYTTTTNTTPVLLSSTISTLLSQNGTGSGPFNNLLLTDLLGATAGMPYTTLFQTLNSTYGNLNTASLLSAVNDLNSAIAANVDYPDMVAVADSVTAINNRLNSLSIPAPAQSAYYQMLNHLTNEVSNLHKAGVVFNSGYPVVLKGFSQNFGSKASDQTQYQTYQFFANLITHDAYGDTLRVAVAESMNTSTLGQGGILVKNDPNPQQALSQSRAQNIPLTTYLSQNK